MNVKAVVNHPRWFRHLAPWHLFKSLSAFSLTSLERLPSSDGCQCLLCYTTRNDLRPTTFHDCTCYFSGCDRSFHSGNPRGQKSYFLFVRVHNLGLWCSASVTFISEASLPQSFLLCSLPQNFVTEKSLSSRLKWRIDLQQENLLAHLNPWSQFPWYFFHFVV